MNKFLIILMLTFSCFMVQIEIHDCSGDSIVLLSNPAIAQEQATAPVQQSVSVAQKEKDKSDLITVMIIVLIIWGGISLYLYMIDKKISRIEKDLH